MLIHELDDGTLLLCQATPRKWLEDGKKIEIERAPDLLRQLDRHPGESGGQGRRSAPRST